MNKRLTNKISAITLSVVRWVFLISVGYIALFPLFAMTSSSFMSMADVLDQSVVYIPKTITFENYIQAITKLNYFKSLKSTFLIPVVAGLIEVATCAITAYGFARFEFKEKNILFGLVIITIAVPATLLMIPQYVAFYNFDPAKIITMINAIFGANININLIDTVFVMWLPSLFSVGLRSGVFIFIYRQFFKGLPKEFEEAAYVDGASPLMAFLKVIVPSSSVAITTVLVFSLVWHWNEYYTTSIFLYEENRPIAVMLGTLRENVQIPAGVLMAGALIFVLPMLIIYLILQRRFIKSIDKVGIVG